MTPEDFVQKVGGGAMTVAQLATGTCPAQIGSSEESAGTIGGTASVHRRRNLPKAVGKWFLQVSAGFRRFLRFPARPLPPPDPAKKRLLR
eukprot:7170786-Alexandrium_andersonii.AAC.1